MGYQKIWSTPKLNQLSDLSNGPRKKNQMIAILDPTASFDEYNLERGRQKQVRLKKKKGNFNRKYHLSEVGKDTRFKKGQFIGDKSPFWKGGPLTKYGCAPDAYDRMFKDQNGVCAICGNPPKKRRLCIDHDHKTGRVRGLLCFRCNYGLGWLKEDRLEKALCYIKSEVDYRARKKLL